MKMRIRTKILMGLYIVAVLAMVINTVYQRTPHKQAPLLAMTNLSNSSFEPINLALGDAFVIAYRDNTALTVSAASFDEKGEIMTCLEVMGLQSYSDKHFWPPQARIDYHASVTYLKIGIKSKLENGVLVPLDIAVIPVSKRLEVKTNHLKVNKVAHENSILGELDMTWLNSLLGMYYQTNAFIKITLVDDLPTRLKVEIYGGNLPIE